MSHKLTPKQRKAIYLLAAGNTTVKVASELSMRRETLSRWRTLPTFNEAFEKVMDEMRWNLRHQLTMLVQDSIRAVRGGMGSYNLPPANLQVSLAVLKQLGIDRMPYLNATGTCANTIETSSNVHQTSPNTILNAPITDTAGPPKALSVLPGN